jgi:hypothetical protein
MLLFMIEIQVLVLRFFAENVKNQRENSEQTLTPENGALTFRFS